jgi:hypothetical protein
VSVSWPQSRTSTCQLSPLSPGHLWDLGLHLGISTEVVPWHFCLELGKSWRAKQELHRGKKEKTEAGPRQSSATLLTLSLVGPSIVSKSYIYWEINSLQGSSFKSLRKHNGRRRSWGLGHNTKTTELSWR